MKKPSHTLPNTVFAFIWYFLRPHKKTVFIYVLLAILAGFWGPLDSILVKHVIDLLPHIQTEHTDQLFFPVSLLVLNFIVFDNLTWRGLTYIRAKLNPVVINHMIGASMDHVLSQSNQFFQDNLSGKISKQISNLADSTEEILSHIGAHFLRGTSHLIISLVTAYFVNPVFSLILFGWLMIFVSISIFLAKHLATLSTANAEAESSVAGELVDTISNHSSVRVFSKKSYEQSRMLPYFSYQKKTYGKLHLYALITQVIQGGLIAIMMALSVYFLVILYAKNLVTTGDFALIFALSIGTGHLLWFTMHQIDQLFKAVGRSKQSLRSIMTAIEITDKADATTLHCTHGSIAFNHVHFQYGDSGPLFNNISVTIPSGQKLGLVGYSGGGKSTFVNLMMRLHDISEGSITIDGTDIRNITQDSLRDNIAMIPQDPVLFQRSLLENIRYGNTNASDEEVIIASKKAHAHEFIDQLEAGYASLVGERGIKLSGGQRQRIAIARAMLKNAPILLLDEATSQLDSLTEIKIQDSLWQLMQNKTTIVIAHRLSTLLHMDRILVFDNGAIVEDGSHEQLLSNKGLYKQLWEAQVGGFLGDKTSPNEC